MDPIEKKITESLIRYSMLPAGSRLGVAVSGGADSVCLVRVLAGLEYAGCIVHVNHGLRGAESEGDEEFVRRLADELGLEVRVVRAEVPESGNLEQEARELRQGVFAGLIEEGVVGRVALAHTRDDQAETVLFRLLRGAYVTGLAGMRPVTPAGLVRPMLEVTRLEVECWLRERGHDWREDSSNRDERFARNRIRRRLLPQLQEEWNPALRDILANHAKLAQEDEDYWAGVLPQMSSILDLRELPPAPALRRRLIRNTIRLVKGDLRGIDFRHIDQVVQLCGGQDGHARVQVPGVDVMKSFDWVRFAKPRPGLSERDWAIDTPVPGVVAVPGGEWEIVLELADSAERRDTLGTSRVDWGRIASTGVERLKLRNWQPGDRYQRQNHSGEDKVKTMFQEARIPLWERRDWPILCLGHEIVWSRRFGVAQPFAAAGEGPALLIGERKRIASRPGSVS